MPSNLHCIFQSCAVVVNETYFQVFTWDNRIREQFELERTSRIISYHPPLPWDPFQGTRVLRAPSRLALDASGQGTNNQHTIGLFSHVPTHTDGHGPLCHFKMKFLKKNFIQKKEWYGRTTEFQELLAFLPWANLRALVFFLELLHCVHTGLSTLWKQLWLEATLRLLFVS